MPDSLHRLLNLFLPTGILLVAGLSILHSIVPALASYHLIFAAVGLLCAFVISRIDLEQFALPSYVWYAISVIPLVMTEVFGIVSRGSTRWISIFGNQLQPSEFAKVTLIVFSALWLTEHDLSSFKNVLKYLALMAFPILLVFIQPDLGSAIMLGSIAIIGLIASGTKARFMVIFALIMALALPLGSLGLKSYQRDRILSFINPKDDHLGSGYNSIQATIAVGSGELAGRGLGQGTQSHLKFLPERHTDFIYASFVEELGFLGGIIIICAYLWLTLNLASVAKSAATPSQSLITLLSAGIILTQSMVNMGMNMGILPITGVTLPLVSNGGSSIISTCLLLGLNWSIILRTKTSTKQLELR